MDMLQSLAALPQNETIFEYLVGCWRRLYGSKLAAQAQVGTHASFKSSRAS